MSTVCAASVSLGETADLPAVMAVMAEAFDPAFGEAWTEAQCASLLGMPGAWLAIARDDRGAAGFALARDIAGEAELLLIAVRPDRRGVGIGHALLDAVLAESRRRGVGSIHLEVRDGNPAEHLYATHDFAEVGRRRDYYRGRDGRLHDARTFRLTL